MSETGLPPSPQGGCHRSSFCKFVDLGSLAIRRPQPNTGRYERSESTNKQGGPCAGVLAD
jgi:hypothetical protein